LRVLSVMAILRQLATLSRQLFRSTG